MKGPIDSHFIYPRFVMTTFFVNPMSTQVTVQTKINAELKPPPPGGGG